MRTINQLTRLSRRATRDLARWQRLANRDDVPRETKLDALLTWCRSCAEYSKARSELNELVRGIEGL
jgi:hypothetical protein